MIAAERVALVMLAAGLSRRFGTEDKLLHPLAGLPLGLHAARTLLGLPFAARIAVTRAPAPDYAAYGFTAVTNPDPAAGQAGSIMLGIAHARPVAPEAVLILLADMPFITEAHVLAVLGRFAGAQSIVASAIDGAHPSPPALFGRGLLDRLEALDGDSGARALLQGAALVSAPAAELRDIDTPFDLPVS